MAGSRSRPCPRRLRRCSCPPPRSPVRPGAARRSSGRRGPRPARHRDATSRLSGHRSRLAAARPRTCTDPARRSRPRRRPRPSSRQAAAPCCGGCARCSARERAASPAPGSRRRSSPPCAGRPSNGRAAHDRHLARPGGGARSPAPRCSRAGSRRSWAGLCQSECVARRRADWVERPAVDVDRDRRPACGRSASGSCAGRARHPGVAGSAARGDRRDLVPTPFRAATARRTDGRDGRVGAVLGVRGIAQFRGARRLRCQAALQGVLGGVLGTERLGFDPADLGLVQASGQDR